MIEALVKANLHLYAVLRNLPDLVIHDPAAKKDSAGWRIAIQYVVRRGPAAWIDFEDGICTFGRGRLPSPDLLFWFFSPDHFNRMMDGQARPFPLRGLRRLGFMRTEFPKVAQRLTCLLNTADAPPADPGDLSLNLRLTMARAVFAARELALFDPPGRQAAAGIRDGAVQLKILPDGPAAHLIFANGEVTAGLGEVQRPMARLDLHDPAIARSFLTGRRDPFTAVATGDVAIRGQIPMIEGLSLILERIPHYLG
jgi:hypothetical protein